MRRPRAALGTIVLTILAMPPLVLVRADDISERAHKLHFSSIVLDTHDDTTQLLLDPGFDLGARHDYGSVDIPSLFLRRRQRMCARRTAMGRLPRSWASKVGT